MDITFSKGAIVSVSNYDVSSMDCQSSARNGFLK